jgi:inhibitor of KinA sporulation pathway (predicted exonuclease)
MNFIVFDLEATCWDGFDKSHNETIEIGAVLVNESKEIVSEFQRFIKPLRFPILSEFCKKLTSIQQTDVDSASYFNEVIEDFKAWFKRDAESYLLCSWGIYDKKQFESDCLLYGIDDSWINPHCNLKKQYGEFKGLQRAIGMQNAILIEKMKLEGTHHRGIDDARNIAKIFVKYFDQWKY